MRDRPLLQLTLIGIVASIVGVVVALLIDWFPASGAEEAQPIDTLYDVLLAVSVPIFVLVMVVAIYSVIKFRARPGDQRDGPPIHGNARLEVVWVTIPFLIVSALAVYGWVVLIDIEEPAPDAMVVEVRGEQFAWSFAYPDDAGGEGPAVESSDLMLPLDRQVEFRINTQDVIHSFWVPAFRLKSDTVPGITTTIRVTPSEEGTFDVVCAELCGLGHSTMRQSVSVVPAEEFESWLAGEQEALAEEGAAEAAGGQSPSGLAGSPVPEDDADAVEDAPANEGGDGAAGGSQGQGQGGGDGAGGGGGGPGA